MHIFQCIWEFNIISEKVKVKWSVANYGDPYSEFVFYI